MSIVDTYRDQFLVYSYDEDLSRSDRMGGALRRRGFQLTSFSSRGLFLETLKIEMPHVVILYYQPLNLKFREMLGEIKKLSSEIEIVVLGSNEFWPGIESLLDAGRVDDFWSWPMPDEATLSLRLNQLLEKNIFRFIAEQRSEETAAIVARLDEATQRPEGENESAVELLGKVDVTDFLGTDHKTEAQLIEDLITNLKNTQKDAEFVYFKNYSAKKQLLVTRTSFASENYFRGQSIAFDLDQLQGDRSQALHNIRSRIEETFSCENFLMQPVEFDNQFFGLLMAVNCTEIPFLQRTARYLSVALRNLSLTHAGAQLGEELTIDSEVSRGQFPLSLSTEVSRARRLKSSVSLIVTHIEYVGEDKLELDRAFDLVQASIRGYDIVGRLEDNKIGIILPHCSYEDAAVKAETIRRQLIAKGLKTQNTPLRLCFGVSEFPRLSPDSDSLLADSKKACAQVMVSGKNKVCLYTTTDNFEPEFAPQV